MISCQKLFPGLCRIYYFAVALKTFSIRASSAIYGIVMASLPSESLVVLGNSFDRMLISGPVSSGNADHGIPRNRLADNLVCQFGTVKNETETAVDSFTDTCTAAVVESD